MHVFHAMFLPEFRLRIQPAISRRHERTDSFIFWPTAPSLKTVQFIVRVFVKDQNYVSSF